MIDDGGPASCTSEAVVAAVKSGGVITFDCGPDPIVIDMEATAFVHNRTSAGRPPTARTRTTLAS